MSTPAAACPACGAPPDHYVHDPRPGGADHPRYSHDVLMAVYQKGRADERARLQRGHEQRMGPLHFVCCFNEVNQRDDFPATGAGGGGIAMSETEQDAAEGTDAQDDTAAAEAAASPAADEDTE